MKKMPRPVVDKHILIYEEDWAWLKANFGGRIGVNQAIRDMVHGRVVALRTRQQEKMDEASSRANPNEVEDRILEVIGKIRETDEGERI